MYSSCAQIYARYRMTTLLHAFGMDREVFSFEYAFRVPHAWVYTGAFKALYKYCQAHAVQ